MERLVVEVEDSTRAKELLSLLAALSFVKRVFAVKDEAKQDASEAVMAHLKEGLSEGQQIASGKQKPLTREQFKASLRS